MLCARRCGVLASLTGSVVSRRHACDWCDKMFARRDKMKVHIQRCHPDKVCNTMFDTGTCETSVGDTGAIDTSPHGSSVCDSSACDTSVCDTTACDDSVCDMADKCNVTV